MARLTAEKWEQARAEYEVRGASLKQVAAAYSVDKAAVSRRAKTEGWIRGKSQPLVLKKVNALKGLAEVEVESQPLTVVEKYTVERVVQERLQAEGLREAFDIALIQKGMELLRAATKTEDWEALSRGRRNLAPVEKSGVSVNVNQSSQTAVLPPPTPRPDKALRAALRGEFEGDDE